MEFENPAFEADLNVEASVDGKVISCQLTNFSAKEAELMVHDAHVNFITKDDAGKNIIFRSGQHSYLFGMKQATVVDCYEAKRCYSKKVSKIIRVQFVN